MTLAASLSHRGTGPTPSLRAAGFACCAYGIGSAVLGQWARLPFFAENADRQIGGGW